MCGKHAAAQQTTTADCMGETPEASHDRVMRESLTQRAVLNLSSGRHALARRGVSRSGADVTICRSDQEVQRHIARVGELVLIVVPPSRLSATSGGWLLQYAAAVASALDARVVIAAVPYKRDHWFETGGIYHIRGQLNRIRRRVGVVGGRDDLPSVAVLKSRVKQTNLVRGARHVFR